MKRRAQKNSFSLIGALGFFALIAVSMQIAILVYDYIISKTESKGLVAILILILISILSIIVTVIDIIRRKIMVGRPVQRIINATEKIASGDFKTQLEIKHAYDKYNEFDIIMENLNIMAKELSKSEIMKNDFIANVSHELKTPLAIIQSYASLLENEDLSYEERQGYIEALRQATERLSALVTNILRLNKLENQAILTEYEKINLTEAVAQIILNFESIIENKNINLDCDLDDIAMVTNYGYVEIIINNLLSNAIKFTGEGGQIDIALKAAPDGAKITVKDTGCGISAQTGKKIFEKFYQEDTSHKKEGNGLGLALVKRVIDIMGGEIMVKSEQGKGSTFTVILKNAKENS